MSRVKSAKVAYLLWFLLGTFGAHRFYLNLYGTGAVLLIITVSSYFLMFAGGRDFPVGYLTIWIPIAWAFVDLFLIPGINRRHNAAAATRPEDGGPAVRRRCSSLIDRMKSHQTFHQ